MKTSGRTIRAVNITVSDRLLDNTNKTVKAITAHISARFAFEYISAKREMAINRMNIYFLSFFRLLKTKTAKNGMAATVNGMRIELKDEILIDVDGIISEITPGVR